MMSKHFSADMLAVMMTWNKCPNTSLALANAPAVDVEEGLGRTAAWYREAGWL